MAPLDLTADVDLLVAGARDQLAHRLAHIPAEPRRRADAIRLPHVVPVEAGELAGNGRNQQCGDELRCNGLAPPQPNTPYVAMSTANGIANMTRFISMHPEITLTIGAARIRRR